MKMMWCWRCKMEVPMLDDEEFTIVAKAYLQSMRAATGPFIEKVAANDTPIEDLIAERFRPVSDAYKQLTGWEERNHNAIIHHQISSYGPPCTHCGKPLRTPRAKFCAACGTHVSSV